MTKPAIFYNAKCVSCEGVDEEMVRVGAIVLCNYCFEHTFKTDDPVKKERDFYLGLLQIQKQNAK